MTRTVIRFGLLGLAEILIFFRNPAHFFTGDSIFWMGNRYHSFAEFLVSFVAVDPALWYRPLAQRTVVSVLFPLVGLNPVPYRVIGFVLFFSCTVVLFLLAKALMENSRAAWFSVLLFAPHLIHVFATYDVAYTPEVMFTLFYLGSALSYVLYLRTLNRRALLGSVLMFAGSLLSKETAVALPFALVAIWLFMPHDKRATARSLAPHFAILGCYLVFALAYLHVRGIDPWRLFDRTAFSNLGDYRLAAGRNVLDNLDTALSWAFGLPRGDLVQWDPPVPWIIPALKAIRALTLLGALFVLLTSRRNFLLLGLAWFLTAIGPALLLAAHFIPSYLFASLAGLALAGGAILDWAYAQCARLSPAVAATSATILIVGWGWIHATAANWIAPRHFLLGQSAKHSEQALRDVRSSYPVLPKGATLVLLNEEGSRDAWWEQGGGTLFRLAFEDPSLKTLYSSEGYSLSAEDRNAGRVLVFKWGKEGLADITPLVQQRPDLLVSGAYHAVELPGVGDRAVKSYTLRIEHLQNAAAEILYALDGNVQGSIKAHLDSRGETKVDIDAPAAASIYTLVAVRREGEPAWVVVNRTIRLK